MLFLKNRDTPTIPLSLSLSLSLSRFMFFVCTYVHTLYMYSGFLVFLVSESPPKGFRVVAVGAQKLDITTFRAKRSTFPFYLFFPSCPQEKLFSHTSAHSRRFGVAPPPPPPPRLRRASPHPAGAGGRPRPPAQPGRGEAPGKASFAMRRNGPRFVRCFVRCSAVFLAVFCCFCFCGFVFLFGGVVVWSCCFFFLGGGVGGKGGGLGTG